MYSTRVHVQPMVLIDECVDVEHSANIDVSNAAMMTITKG